MATQETVGLLTRYEDEAIPPSPDLSSDYRLQWCKVGMLEGEQYLRNQPMYEKQSEVREYLLGFKNTLRASLGLSDIQVNELWRIYQTLAGDWNDTNPFWAYGSENPADQKQAQVLGRLAKINYVRSGSDGQVTLMTRQSLESASGVLGLGWDRQKQDLAMRSWTPDDVLPIRPNEMDSYQSCLAVCARREVTVNFAKDMFPHMADYIVMDRDAALTGLGMRHRELLRNRIAGSVSAFEIVDVMDALPTQRLGAMPVVDLFYMYIDDRSINQSSTEPIMMGDWDRDPKSGNPIARNYWSYIVHPGKPKYPTKRLIIFTRRCILYDGPSPYWHGMFPFVKFTPDPYNGLWFGISPLFPCLPLQYSLDKIYRAYDDHIQKVLRPPVFGDKNSISQPELDKIDPRQQGQRWRQNPHGKGVQVAQIPNMDPVVEIHKLDLRDRMNEISGAKALNVALDIAKAGQIPEGETVEKLAKLSSIINSSRSKQLERAQVECGKMQAYNLCEFYDVRKRYWALGEDGKTPYDLDFDPYSIVPYYKDGSFTSSIDQSPGDDSNGRIIDMRPRMDRAIDSCERLSLTIKPGNLLESASQNRKMMIMLLRSRNDYPLFYTLKALGLDENLGPEPQGTMIELIMAEKQLIAQAEMGAPGFVGPGGGSPAGPGGAGPSPKEGRPNTMNESPHIEGQNSERPKLATS